MTLPNLGSNWSNTQQRRKEEIIGGNRSRSAVQMCFVLVLHHLLTGWSINIMNIFSAFWNFWVISSNFINRKKMMYQEIRLVDSMERKPTHSFLQSTFTEGFSLAGHRAGCWHYWDWEARGGLTVSLCTVVACWSLGKISLLITSSLRACPSCCLPSLWWLVHMTNSASEVQNCNFPGIDEAIRHKETVSES